MEGIARDVQALGVFRCEEGHIFFIRGSDLEGAESFRASA
jgi:hypothetical protein